MALIILGIVAAWVMFSALLVTMVCINSSQLSQMEEPSKVRSTRARSRARKTAAKIKSSPIPASSEVT